MTRTCDLLVRSRDGLFPYRCARNGNTCVCARFRGRDVCYALDDSRRRPLQRGKRWGNFAAVFPGQKFLKFTRVNLPHSIPVNAPMLCAAKNLICALRCKQFIAVSAFSLSFYLLSHDLPIACEACTLLCASFTRSARVWAGAGARKQNAGRFQRLPPPANMICLARF